MPAGDTPDLFEVHIDTPEQLESILAMFEERFESATGQRLTSGQFYERYRSGEHDAPVGFAWVTYFEAYLEMTERSRGLSQVVPPAALAVC